jgi:hypothetical protein
MQKDARSLCLGRQELSGVSSIIHTRVDGTALDAIILRVCCAVASVIPSGRVISGFRHEVEEPYTLLGYCAACSDNSLPTFRDSLSVPSSRANKSKFNVTGIKMYMAYGIRSGTLAGNMQNRLHISASVLSFQLLIVFL